MIENTRLYERLGLVGVVFSQLANNTTKSTAWVAIAQTRRFLALLNLGATDTTVDFKIEKATASDGTGATPAVSATQLAATDDNKRVALEVASGNLGSTYTHVRATVTIGSGSTGANVGVELIGGDARYGEEYLLNATDVAQIATV